METVSKEQAQSDVSLLFRTLQSAYGAYEYFGQEKFDAAEDAVTQWLSSQDDEIKVSALGETLQESLAFMLAHDAHAMIYEPAAEEIEAQVRYEYFFADGFYFSKDVNGSYYMVNDGERWTLSSFSDEHVSVQPTLLQDGRIVYQPTLFALRKCTAVECEIVSVYCDACVIVCGKNSIGILGGFLSRCRHDSCHTRCHS